MTATTTRALLSRHEAADYLGIGLRTLDRLVAEKQIRAEALRAL